MEGADSPDGNATVKKIEELAWRQGSILPSELIAPLRFDAGLLPDGQYEFGYIVTGDCNVLHHDLVEEPVVEVIVGTVVEEANGTYTNGKNPRRLHIGAVADGKQVTLEFRAARRASLQRETLATARPGNGPTLSEAGRLLLANWWAGGRYLRPSFPNAFNDRVRQADKKRRIERLLKPHREHILGVFVVVYPDAELTSNEDYTVVLRMVITDEADSDPACRDSIDNDAYGPLIDLLRTGTGIQVSDDDLQSESDFTYADYRRMLRFEVDHLSYDGMAGDEEGPIAPRT
jgi:hypothetical protein